MSVKEKKIPSVWLSPFWTKGSQEKSYRADSRSAAMHLDKGMRKGEGLGLREGRRVRRHDELVKEKKISYMSLRSPQPGL